MLKKFFIICLLSIICFTSKSYADTSYSAKSTVTQSNAQEVIKMDVIPIIKVNSNSPTQISPASETYVAPLIAPAREDKPSLNFNVNNIKNVKKGAILPKDNVNQSVTSISRYFNSSYDKVFSHLVGIIDNSEFELVSYDSNSGKIFANYKRERPVYITVSQYNSFNVLVKVTPADGIYNIPSTATDALFSNLSRSLTAK